MSKAQEQDGQVGASSDASPERPSEDFDAGFAPSGPNDGRDFVSTPVRPVLEWRTAYSDPQARRWIRIETLYLTIIVILSVGGAFWIFATNRIDPWARDWGLLVIGGLLGGGVFALKWQYHVIARGIWHMDRRAWRFTVPLNSGIVALMFGLLIRSDLVAIFRSDSLTGEAAIGFAFLVGYFSDHAIAKLREIAGTVFGQTEQHRSHPSARG